MIEAGKTRLRPVLMTALAMIIGMVPMALGLGEAGEQNAPLGRAVIGGLAFATFATLFLVPIFYTLLRRKLPTLHTLDKRFAAEAAGASTGGSAMPDGQPSPKQARGRVDQVLSRSARRRRGRAQSSPSAISISAATTASPPRARRAAAAVDRGPRVEVVDGDARADRAHHHAARRRALRRRPRSSTPRSAAT